MTNDEAWVRAIWVLTILSLLCLPEIARSAPTVIEKPTNQNFLQRAQKEFTQANYNTAIVLYRKYLRHNRRDADAWSQLAVCFYYTGETEKALTYLRKWEDRSATKSYNQYHQGLVYLSLSQPQKARAPLIRAARYTDEYAARATYEMAVLEYQDRDVVKARYWINLYKQRYPQGGFIAAVLRLEQFMNSNAFLDTVEGNKRPDTEESLFRYHRYSLTKLPHFWFIRYGYNYLMGDSVQPDLNPDNPVGTRVEPYSAHDLIIYSGIGLGPVKQNDVTAWVGYNYYQDWFSDQDRIDSYLEGASDFTDYLIYLPFRPDLLQRTHRVYGEIEYDAGEGFYTGIEARQEYAFMGSSLIPGPEGDEIDSYSTQIFSANLLRPFVGYRYRDVSDTQFYFYMFKQLEKDAPEYSHKTYDLLGNEPVLSVGITHHTKLPEYGLNLYGEIFQYEYLYNDYWLDFTRLGIVLGTDFDIEVGTKVMVMAGYYEDTFQLDVISQGSCNYSKKGKTQGEEDTVVRQCPRKDTGYVLKVGLTYDMSQFSRAALSFSMVENQNPTLNVYERTDQAIEFSVTTAFPNNNRVSRFIERYAAEAFTKKVD